MNENEIDKIDPFEGRAFRGNKLVKGADEVAFISKDDFQHYTKEIVKCAQDVIYFANNYFTIISPGQGKHIIDTYPKQDDLIKTMVDEDRVVCLASRQTGKCVFENTKISIRNKTTGEIEEIEIGEFYKKIKQS